MKATENKVTIARILVCAVFCAGAIAVEVVTIRGFIQTREIGKWPTTKGTITRSEIETSRLVKKRYELNIEYNYEVDGKSYSSSRVRKRGVSSKRRGDAYDMVSKYPVGSECVVFYDEDNPSNAFLESGADLGSYISIVAPLILSVLLAWLLIGMIRERRQLSFQKRGHPEEQEGPTT